MAAVCHTSVEHILFAGKWGKNGTFHMYFTTPVYRIYTSQKPSFGLIVEKTGGDF